MTEVGTAWVTVVPSAKGFQSALKGQIMPALQAAEKDIAKNLGTKKAAASFLPTKTDIKDRAKALGKSAGDGLRAGLRDSQTSPKGNKVMLDSMFPSKADINARAKALGEHAGKAFRSGMQKQQTSGTGKGAMLNSMFPSQGAINKQAKQVATSASKATKAASKKVNARQSLFPNLNQLQTKTMTKGIQDAVKQQQKAAQQVANAASKAATSAGTTAAKQAAKTGASIPAAMAQGAVNSSQNAQQKIRRGFRKQAWGGLFKPENIVSARSLGSGLNSAGRSLTWSASGAAGLTLGLATYLGASLESAVSRAASAAPGALEDEALFAGIAQQYSAAARELAKETVFNPTEAAQGLEYLTKGGLTADQALGSLNTTANLAIAGQLEFADAARIVATGMNVYSKQFESAGLTAEQSATQIGDALGTAAIRSNADVGDLAQGLTYTANSAATMGYTIGDTAAALGVLADSGLNASKGGTSLNQFFSAMVSSQKKGTALADSWKELGISAFDSKQQLKPLGQVLHDISDLTEGMTKQEELVTLARLFPNVRNARAAQALVRSIGKGEKSYDGFRQAIEESGGSLEKLEKKSMGPTQRSFELMKGALQNAGIAIGESVAPSFRDAANWIDKFAESLAAADPGKLNAIAKGLFAIAVTGPLLWGAGGTIRSIAAIGGAVGWAGGKVAALTRAATAATVASGGVGLIPAATFGKKRGGASRFSTGLSKALTGMGLAQTAASAQAAAASRSAKAQQKNAKSTVRSAKANTKAFGGKAAKGVAKTTKAVAGQARAWSGLMNAMFIGGAVTPLLDRLVSKQGFDRLRRAAKALPDFQKGVAGASVVTPVSGRAGDRRLSSKAIKDQERVAKASKGFKQAIGGTTGGMKAASAATRTWVSDFALLGASLLIPSRRGDGMKKVASKLASVFKRGGKDAGDFAKKGKDAGKAIGAIGDKTAKSAKPVNAFSAAFSDLGKKGTKGANGLKPLIAGLGNAEKAMKVLKVGLMVGKVGGPLAIITTAAQAGMAMYENSEKLQEVAGSFGRTVQSAFRTSGGNFFADMLGSVQDFGRSLGAAFEPIQTMLSPLGDLLGNIAGGAGDAIAGIFGPIQNSLENLWGAGGFGGLEGIMDGLTRAMVSIGRAFTGFGDFFNFIDPDEVAAQLKEFDDIETELNLRVEARAIQEEIAAAVSKAAEVGKDVNIPVGYDVSGAETDIETALFKKGGKVFEIPVQPVATPEGTTNYKIALDDAGNVEVGVEVNPENLPDALAAAVAAAGKGEPVIVDGKIKYQIDDSGDGIEDVSNAAQRAAAGQTPAQIPTELGDPTPFLEGLSVPGVTVPTEAADPQNTPTVPGQAPVQTTAEDPQNTPKVPGTAEVETEALPPKVGGLDLGTAGSQTVDVKLNVTNKGAVQAALPNNASVSVSVRANTGPIDRLQEAIDAAVVPKSAIVTATADKGPVDRLKRAIDLVEDKDVDVVANVSGLGDVQSLVSAIANVNDKDVTITVTTVKIGGGGGGGGGDSSGDGGEVRSLAPTQGGSLAPVHTANGGDSSGAGTGGIAAYGPGGSSRSGSGSSSGSGGKGLSKKADALIAELKAWAKTIEKQGYSTVKAGLAAYEKAGKDLGKKGKEAFDKAYGNIESQGKKWMDKLKATNTQLKSDIAQAQRSWKFASRGSSEDVGAIARDIIDSSVVESANKRQKSMLREIGRNAKKNLNTLSKRLARYEFAADLSESMTDSARGVINWDEMVKPEDLVSALQGATPHLETFARDMGKLRKGGMSDKFMQQLATMDPAKAAQLARALVMDPNAMKQVNTEYSKFDNAVRDVGDMGAAAAWAESGKAAAQGFIKGMSGDEKKIRKQVQRIAKQTVKAFKKTLGIKSPSAVFQAQAKQVSAGIARGLRSKESKNKVKKAGKELGKEAIKATSEAMQKDADKEAKKAVGKFSKAMKKARKKVKSPMGKKAVKKKKIKQKKGARGTPEEVGGALDPEEAKRAAEEEADTLKGIYDGWVDQVTSSLQSAFDRMTGSVEIGEIVSPSQLNRQMKRATDDINKMAGNMATLKGMGLSDAVLAQIGEMDPRQAARFTQRLLANPALIGELNSNQAAFEQAGMNAAEGIAAGALREKDRVDDAMEVLAKSMVEALKGVLKIESPSKVFAKQGRMIGKGLSEGVRSEYANVEASVEDMVHVPNLSGWNVHTANSNFGAGGGGVQIDVHPSTGMDEQLLAKKVSRELIWSM